MLPPQRSIFHLGLGVVDIYYLLEYEYCLQDLKISKEYLNAATTFFTVRVRPVCTVRMPQRTDNFSHTFILHYEIVGHIFTKNVAFIYFAKGSHILVRIRASA